VRGDRYLTRLDHPGEFEVRIGCIERSRPLCALRHRKKEKLPVITETGLDIGRYIGNVWFGPKTPHTEELQLSFAFGSPQFAPPDEGHRR
jgi:hypothetical protein